MKKRHLIAYIALVSTSLATEPGQSIAVVLAERGEPLSRLSVGDVVVLNYKDASIRLKDNVVTDIKAAAAGQVSVVHAEARRARPVPRSGESTGAWTTDLKAALETAKVEHRNIFLFFTGSDWCGWCKKLNLEILSKPEFVSYAAEKLVLVEVDFPRTTPQSPELVAQNQALQRHFGITGYPTVVVLSARGDVLGKLHYENSDPAAFVGKLAALETR